jgi:hypothetical protein
MGLCGSALLPGEDRSFGSGLFVDLVPSSCWFTNVRSCVSQRDWARLRRMITTRAGQRCEVCGRGQDRESGRWLEGHERLAYDGSANIQALRRLICPCTDCHTATHFGLARANRKDAAALRHLCAVTGMSSDKARQHVDAAFALWSRRSSVNWRLELSMLTDAGIAVTEPPSARERASFADQALRRL